jgi:ribonuclease HI
MNDPGVMTIHTDGAARGNPGPAAYAYVIDRSGAAPIAVSQRLGLTTNNVAEYTALLKALEHAHRLGGRRLQVYSDSELMVKQMNGEYKVKHPGLLPLYEEAREAVRDFDQVTIRHVRREDNGDADRLCNEALDGMESPEFAASPEAVVKRPPSDGASALAYLQSQAALWARGDPTKPDPGFVLSELRKKLQGERRGAKKRLREG